MDRSILNVTDDELARNVNVDSATQQEEPFLMEEESCRESATEAARPSEMEFNGTSVDRIDKCDCIPGERVVPFEATDGGQARCPLCGKILVIEAQSSPQATGEPLGLLFGQTFSNNLNFLPDTPETSLDSNGPSIGELVGNNSRQQHRLSPAEQDIKTPVQDFCDTSVEIPCRDGDCTVFIIGQGITETNELRLSAYVISSEIFQKGNINRWIESMEEQQGMKTGIVPVGDEYSTLQECRYFHTIFLDKHMYLTIKFQLLEHLEGEFRIRAANPAVEFPLHRILSLGQNRLPAAIASVVLECLGRPKETCQAHVRMILEYGDTIKNVLIPIWSKGRPR